MCRIVNAPYRDSDASMSEVGADGELPLVRTFPCRVTRGYEPRCAPRSDNMTAMSTHLRDLVVERVGPIVETLNDVMETAVSLSEQAITQTAKIGRDYRSTRVHVARAKARSLLLADEPAGWNVDKRPNNAGLHLYGDDMTLRFLHSRTVVPSPGPNSARRAWYLNSPLEENPALFEEPEKFLLVWGADFDAGLASMRIVHPIGTWRFGGNARIDLDFPLDDPEVFTSSRFDTRDEEEDLPMPSKEEAAEEGDERDASA